MIIRVLIAASLALAARHGDAATRQTCIASAELRGANPSWGGHNMFLTPKRNIWMQIVEPDHGKLVERRYRRRIADPEVAELRRIVGQRFRKLKDATRPPAPNELLWRGAIVTCDGRKQAVRQFTLDAEPAFQEFIAWFQRTAAAAVSGPPIYEGVPQFEWEPAKE